MNNEEATKFLETSNPDKNFTLKPIALDQLTKDVVTADARIHKLNSLKHGVIENGFDSQVIIDAILEIKFDCQDKIVYNAFCTWLWTAIPDDGIKNS